MVRKLEGRLIAILATHGVEQVELVEPRRVLQAEGAETRLVSLEPGAIQGMDHIDKADMIPVDVTLDDVEPGGFHALLLPGGAVNPDTLRMDPRAVDFVRYFYDHDKPVAAICHAPWMLVEADVVRGLTLTSWPSLQTDIRNAGGNWTDAQIVNDHGVVTSRGPDDIPAFNEAIVEQFQVGRIKGRHKAHVAPL